MYWNIPVKDDGKWESEIDAVARDRQYKNRDVKESSKAILGDSYEEMMKMVYKE